MSENRASILVAIAREIASSRPDFQAVLGPGAGDRATGAFMDELRERAASAFGEDCSEKRICGENSLAVDFYFEEEGTIVEVALGLPNPSTEYEKDILKAIMAQECGKYVQRLIFVSRPGAEKKCHQPGRTAVRKWAHSKHGLLIEVNDLHGEPRVRKRRPRRSQKV